MRGRHSKAFSLVELSIVLVILGLLVGGVFAGQSLVRAAELRSISSDYARFTAAMTAFQDKFSAMPGDMTNATLYWGTAAACPGNNTTPSTTQAACNGNGDSSLQQNLAASNELFRFWQHLANAELITGSYPGVSDHSNGGSAVSTPAFNVPASRIDNAGWSALTIGNVDSSNTVYFDGTYGTSFTFGKVYPGGATRNAAIRPQEAWNIDTKLDDGMPAIGSVVTMEYQSGTVSTHCIDLAGSTTVPLTAAVYVVSRTGINCSFVFKTGK